MFWFQDRMEYGPRALGNRSILAPSDSDEVKEKLNLFVKQREWFQPFAPSMLEEDVPKLVRIRRQGLQQVHDQRLQAQDGARPIERSVAHVDGTVRAQMVGDENRTYREPAQGGEEAQGLRDSPQHELQHPRACR